MESAQHNRAMATVSSLEVSVSLRPGISCPGIDRRSSPQNQAAEFINHFLHKNWHDLRMGITKARGLRAAGFEEQI
jgi:hypothetical protein